MNQVTIFTFALVAALCLVVQVTEAGKKGDIIVVGGKKGCGPQMLLKTDKKKGDILVMNPCHKEKKVEYVPYPVYTKDSYDDSHGYGDTGYEMDSHDGGYENEGY